MTFVGLKGAPELVGNLAAQACNIVTMKYNNEEKEEAANGFICCYIFNAYRR